MGRRIYLQMYTCLLYTSDGWLDDVTQGKHFARHTDTCLENAHLGLLVHQPTIAVLTDVYKRQDMWMVNKRYLYDDMFVDKAQRDTPKQMTETDKIICRDKALHYREMCIRDRRDIIQPTIAVLTNLGAAHQENFSSMEEKIGRAHV